MQQEYLHCSRRRVCLSRLVLFALASVATAFATSGCTTTMDIQVVGRPGVAALPPKGADCGIKFQERESAAAPPGCSEIADAWFGDTGGTIDCGWDRVSHEAMRKGCELGADIAQVVWNQPPDTAGSSCSQIRVRYLSCAPVTGGTL